MVVVVLQRDIVQENGVGGLWVERIFPGYNRECDSVYLGGVTGDLCLSCSIGLFCQWCLKI